MKVKTQNFICLRIIFLFQLIVKLRNKCALKVKKIVCIHVCCLIING